MPVRQSLFLLRMESCFDGNGEEEEEEEEKGASFLSLSSSALSTSSRLSLPEKEGSRVALAALKGAAAKMSLWGERGGSERMKGWEIRLQLVRKRRRRRRRRRRRKKFAWYVREARRG